MVLWNVSANHEVGKLVAVKILTCISRIIRVGMSLLLFYRHCCRPSSQYLWVFRTIA